MGESISRIFRFDSLQRVRTSTSIAEAHNPVLEIDKHAHFQNEHRSERHAFGGFGFSGWQPDIRHKFETKPAVPPVPKETKPAVSTVDERMNILAEDFVMGTAEGLTAASIALITGHATGAVSVIAPFLLGRETRRLLLLIKEKKENRVTNSLYLLSIILAAIAATLKVTAVFGPVVGVAVGLSYFAGLFVKPTFGKYVAPYVEKYINWERKLFANTIGWIFGWKYKPIREVI